MDIFDLQAKLSLDSSEYEKGVEQSGSKLKSLASGVGTAAKTVGKIGVAAAGAVTAAVGGIVAATGKTATYGDQIDKMSQKLGMSAKAYQEWDFILQHNGASIESMGTTMKTLSNAVENQSKESVEAFNAIGLSMKDLEGLSQEDLFAKTVTALQGMESGTERTALATKLLGRGAMEMGALLNQSAEETEAMRQQVHDLGGVMSDDAVKSAASFQDSLQNMKTAVSGVGRSLTTTFMPYLGSVMNGIAAIVSGNDEGIDRITEGLEGFIDTISSSIPKIAATAARILPAIVSAITANMPMLLNSASEILTALAQGILDNLPSLVSTAGEIILQLASTMIAMLPQIIEVGLQVIVQLALGIADALPKLIPTIVDVILQIVETLIDNVDMLIDASIAIIMALANGLINALPRLIAKAPEIISKLVQAIINNAPKLLQAAFELIVTLASGLIQNIPKLIQTALEMVASIASGIISGIGNVASAAWEIVKSIGNIIGELPKKALQWGKDMIQGFINGIKAVKDKIKGAVSGVADKIKSFLHFSRPDEGPLRDYEEWMPDFMTGLANGIKRNQNKVADAVKSVTESMQMQDFTVGVNAIANAKTTSLSDRVAASYDGAVFNINISGIDPNNAKMTAERISQELAILTRDNASMVGGYA